jgi:hypothetical protein
LDLLALIVSETPFQAVNLMPLRASYRSSKLVGVGSAVGVGVGVGSAVGVGVGVDCATGDGFGGEIFTPLLQIIFLPDLMQVNFMPAEVLTWPIFLQIAPGLTAALEVGALTDKANAPINAVAIERFIGNILLSS